MMLEIKPNLRKMTTKNGERKRTTEKEGKDHSNSGQSDMSFPLPPTHGRNPTPDCFKRRDDDIEKPRDEMTKTKL